MSQVYAIFADFVLLKTYVVGTHLNCIDVDAIQMGTHNICLYKEVDRKYSDCNLKTTELLDCAFVGVCAIIRANVVFRGWGWGRGIL